MTRDTMAQDARLTFAVAAEEEDAAPSGPLLRQSRLTDQVYELLLLDIARGAYRIGDRLPSEPQLCADFGVSRPVVREALARLRADNILRSRRGSGSYVTREPSHTLVTLAPSGTVAEMLRAHEFRLGMETEAAAIAAERRDMHDLDAMDRAVAALADALERDDVGAEADLEFHRAVALATRNHLFVQSIQMLSAPILTSITVARRVKQLGDRHRLNEVLAEHEEITAAIRDQKIDAARRAMHSHLARSRDRMLGFMTE